MELPYGISSYVIIEFVAFCLSCHVGVFVYGGSSLLPTWDIWSLLGLLLNVPILC